MVDERDRIIENAQQGRGSCRGCSAHETTDGALVNPGLGNPDGELVFVSEEPRHRPDWTAFDSWTEYNEEWWPRVKDARGGRFVARLLDRVDLDLDDIWLTDSIKCPTKRDDPREILSANTDDAFSHCYPYLRAEINRVDPRGVITLGTKASRRTLQVISTEPYRAQSLRVTKDYGHARFDADYPVVISLHWAQRTVPHKEWVPVVKQSIVDIVG